MKGFCETTVEPDQTSSSPPPPNRSLGPPLVSGMAGWVGHHAPNHAYNPHTVLTMLPNYKKHSDGKEIEDSSSVVSSTQDFEPGGGGGRYPGDVPRLFNCPEESHRVRQDHFGSLIGMLSELQDPNCTDLEQILAEGNFNPEIKTETTLEALQIPHTQHQTDIGYLPNQDLYPSAYLRQNCPSGETGYRYSPVGGREEESSSPALQYPTQLHLKAGYAPLSPLEKGGGPYSPLSPASPSVKSERSKDDKYWERRRKNNLAAKKSRDARRVRENQLRLRVLCSENQIRVLRSQLDRAQEDNLLLRERLKKYEGEVDLPTQENYNMAAAICEADFSARGGGETDFRLSDNSTARGALKSIEDDMQHMSKT